MRLRRSFKLKNELVYTPATWAEFTDPVNKVTNDGYLILDNLSSSINIRLSTNFKPATKYGMIINIRTNTRINNTQCVVGSELEYPLISDLYIPAGTKGNFKYISMTNNSFIYNKYYGWVKADTGKIEMGNLRCFELPTGSQIEADFTNLTADQLAVKYPWFYDQTASGVMGEMGGLK